MSKDAYQKIGDRAFNNMEKINSELLSLMYGTLVTQLIKDIGDIDAVNTQLDQMGYNIGLRLIDEFLAKSGVSYCTSFEETSQMIAKVALKMFLGISGEITNWNSSGTACSIILQENPLTNFVEIPPSLHNISYSNILCGAIRGALEQLQIKVNCVMTEDILKGSDYYEIRLELIEIMKEDAFEESE